MPPDLLADAAWSCVATEPDAVTTPGGLAPDGWLPASVPGTAAGALRDAGLWAVPDPRNFDAEDWWFRCRFSRPSSSGPWLLRLEGLATIAEVWLNGALLGRSEGMFTPLRLEVTDLAGDNELAIRFLALGPRLAAKHPRPRWHTRLVAHQHLRWYRTTFLGRMPGWASLAAPVGPWRPVTLEPAGLVERRIAARCDGDDGVVDIELRVAPPVMSVVVRVGDATATMPVGEGGEVRGQLRVPGVERWWPHTHGPSPRYAVEVEVDGEVTDLGSVGFRTIEADRGDGGFQLAVNGVPVFCRGACWVPPDVVTLNAAAADVRRTLELARDAGMNMVRLTGTMVYEDATFWDLCDELGILVWQDCMFANVDPPDDDAFLSAVEAELTEVLGALAGRPSLAVVCGGSEVEQQAAMLGLSPERRGMPLFDSHIPKLLTRLGLDVPYVSSSPSGGPLPFHPGAGVAHYYGVGGYLRPLEDVRRTGVRFASECLAFANPPERGAVEEMFGGPEVAGHDPRWKSAVPRDAGSSWDFEDVRDHYVELLFGVDARHLRSTDPERYLDLGRAAVVELMAGVFAEWRRPGSSCAGGLVLQLRDLRPGAGWGILDAEGGPKAPWWALRRVFAPVALLATDEGMNGLHLHALNDRPTALDVTIDVTVFDVLGQPVERGSTELTVPPRGATTLSADALLDGFRDLTYAYRFGPRAYDLVVATLRAPDGAVLGEAMHLVGGLARPIEPTVGLRGSLERSAESGWTVTVTTDRLAQHVVIDVPGFLAEDSWFHLPPAASRVIRLRGPSDLVPRGDVRALNSRAAARLRPS
jgi:beta-mannosidase